MRRAQSPPPPDFPKRLLPGLALLRQRAVAGDGDGDQERVGVRPTEWLHPGFRTSKDEWLWRTAPTPKPQNLHHNTHTLHQVMGAVIESGAEPMLIMEFMEHGSLPSPHLPPPLRVPPLSRDCCQQPPLRGIPPPMEHESLPPPQPSGTLHPATLHLPLSTSPPSTPPLFPPPTSTLRPFTLAPACKRSSDILDVTCSWAIDRCPVA